MHNGVIAGYNHELQRKLLSVMNDEGHSVALEHSAIDSAAVFGLFLTELSEIESNNKPANTYPPLYLALSR
jgi:predicted glutamine amidotransferase